MKITSFKTISPPDDNRQAGFCSRCKSFLGMFTSEKCFLWCEMCENPVFFDREDDNLFKTKVDDPNEEKWK